MNESTVIIDLISKGGIAGALVLAVWYVAKKLDTAYESRIVALERASEACEKDRVELRNMIIRAKFEDGATFNLHTEKQ